MDQTFCDLRMVDLGSSQTQVSFGYPFITLHILQFETLFLYTRKEVLGGKAAKSGFSVALCNLLKLPEWEEGPDIY